MLSMVCSVFCVLCFVSCVFCFVCHPLRATRTSCLSSSPFAVLVSVRVCVRLFVFRNGDDLKEKWRGPANLFDEPMMQWIEDQEKRNLTPYKDEILQEYGRMRASLDAAVSVSSG